MVQAFAPNNGWDHKLWAIGNRVFTALRRSELADEESAAGTPRANRFRSWRS